MPRGDGTGPSGYGPLTGRRMGPCGTGFGQGFRGGFGRGYGPCWRSLGQQSAGPDIAARKRWLTDMKKMLEDELKQVETEEREIKKQ